MVFRVRQEFSDMKAQLVQDIRSVQIKQARDKADWELEAGKLGERVGRIRDIVREQGVAVADIAAVVSIGEERAGIGLACEEQEVGDCRGMGLYGVKMMGGLHGTAADYTDSSIVSPP